MPNNASTPTPGPEPPTPIGMLTLGIPGSPDTYAHHHRRVVLGITLANAYCDRGYGTEALRWALAWAFGKAGLHRVSLQVGDRQIGALDDLIITTDHKLFAVLQVGGFLGLGGYLIALPYESLAIDDHGRKITLAGASKDAVHKLPEFQYPKSS